jgi:soluble lytic murein transglycosylase
MLTLKTKITVAWMTVIFLAIPLTGISDDALESQRETFKKAERALRYQKDGEYYIHKKALRESNYILYPYLQYYELKRMLGQPNDPSEHVRRFLRAQKDTTLEKQMRNVWLEYLAKRKKWSDFVKDYEPSQSVSLQCYDIYARYQVSKDKAILKEAEPLWLYGKSRPKACDDLFDTWIKADGLSEKLAWDRIELAINANQYQLVAYLKRYLPHDEHPLVDAWLHVYKDPKLVTSQRLFKAEHPFLRMTQVYGVKKLARTNIDQAIKAWNTIDDQHNFTEEQKIEVYKRFALEKATDHEPGAEKWFNKVPIEKYDTTLHEWHVRNAIRHGKWKDVINAIAQMPPALQQENAWQYWKARALSARGQKKEAEKIFQQLSQQRDYYGFMASDIIGSEYPMNLPTAVVSQEDMEKVKKIPDIQRALELKTINRTTDGRREWEYASRKMDEQQLQAAAIYANELDWHDRAILTLAKAENRNDINLRFPMAYSNTVQREARQQGLNPAWVYAIARRESAFVPDARSPAGAIGVMQVMPYTAKQIAREIKEPYFSRNQLLNLNKNVRLGSAYLNKMYGQMNKNLVLATASYNAGPHRVKKWLPAKTERLDPDVWIDTMPFYETREYVKAILVYRIIYQYHMGKTDSRIKDTLEPITAF